MTDELALLRQFRDSIADINLTVPAGSSNAEWAARQLRTLRRTARVYRDQSALAQPAPDAGEPVERIPDGMREWRGGDTAPADWDGGPVLLRDGSHGDGEDWRHLVGVDDIDSDNDIVAYTPKPTKARAVGEIAADLIDRTALKSKLDDLIVAASKCGGAGSEQHNLIRDVSDALASAPAYTSTNQGEASAAGEGQ